MQGEPSAPEKAEEGLVWRSIVEQIDQPGSAGQWVSVDDLERGRYFGKQPWVLADGGLELNRTIGRYATSRLGEIQRSIGRYVHTGNDAAYFAPSRTWHRFGANEVHTVPLITGEDVRDWNLNAATEALFPYGESLRAELTSDIEHLLWRNRTPLRRRQELGGTPEEIGLNWYEWSRWHPERFSDPMGISFPFVATHNHFALDRGGKVFNRHAPVIKLQEEATEEDYVQLLGLLNSSTAGFWLKMVSHDKGSQGVNEGYKSQVWERFYEFTGTKIQEFPLPAEYPTALATELDALAQQLHATTPAALATEAIPAAAALREAQARYNSTRARMIALQEELDWQVYSLYDLHSEDLRLPDTCAVPELTLGERAFEIVLARRVAAGEASGEWFKRHGSTPITEIPTHWPADYQALVQRRIEVIESNRAIGMVERPEYKRRWATEGWDAMRQRALKSWLLDRVEDRTYWFDASGNPTVTTLARLAESLSADEDFTSVAELYAPRQDLVKTVRELLSEEHVPFVSALRYKPTGLKKRADWEQVWKLQREEDATPDEPAKRKVRERTPVPPKYTSADFLKPSYWRARGKLDVPKERFVSYGTVNAQSPELYGWAGWDHLEQALALASYIQQAGLSDDDLVPYLAGLLELQPWLEQWYGEYDPEFGASPAAEILAFRQQKQGELGLTDDALRAWRPSAASRGRGASKAATSRTRTGTKAAVQTSIIDADNDTVTEAVSGAESA